MTFWTILLEVFEPVSDEAKKALEDNCTYVTKSFWIMEGDTDYLASDGVNFREVAEGAVGSLAGLTEAELKRICFDSYGVKL